VIAVQDNQNAKAMLLISQLFESKVLSLNPGSPLRKQAGQKGEDTFSS
jgi:hypothetical protein